MLTNTNSTAPYRGAGRPEATYVIERLIDDAARELGLDPVELRRKNLIPRLGDAVQDAARRDLRLRRVREEHGGGAEARRRRGLRRPGARRRARAASCAASAVVNAIEQAAGPAARVRRDPLHAERHARPCSWAPRTRARATRPCSSRSCTSGSASIPKDVHYIDGDTDRVAFGMGTMGSRSTVIGGTALWMAADKVIAKGKKIAAQAAGGGRGATSSSPTASSRSPAPTARVALKGGRARRVPAAAAPARPRAGPLRDGHVRRRKQDTWPNGCHVCEVEIDPDTGAVTLDRLRRRRRRRHRDQSRSRSRARSTAASRRAWARR